MDSLYFLCMLIGIAWLCWWTTRPPGSATGSGRWSPFDMREPADNRVVPDASFDPGDSPRTARRIAAAAPAEPQRALPERRRPASWRLREKPAGPPGRERRG